MHALLPSSSAGTCQVKLEEQFASFAGSRLTLHSGLSAQERKQNEPTGSSCATQMLPAGHSALVVQLASPQ